MGRFIRILLVALVVLAGSFYLYQRNIAAVPVSAADLDKGGTFTTEEQSSLTAASRHGSRKTPIRFAAAFQPRLQRSSHGLTG